MKNRIVWPIVGVLGVGMLAVLLSSVRAQRPPMGFGGPPQPGRFVVAHASAERIVILDSATGQLYVGSEKDFKKLSELPRQGEGRPPFMDKDREKRRDKDGQPPRERRPKKDDKEKEKEKEEDKDEE